MMAKGFFFIKSFMSDNCDMIIISCTQWVVGRLLLRLIQ